MKLQIISFVAHENHWLCKDECGLTHRVDLAVCGTGDGILIGHSPRSFDGRFLESGDLTAYEEIAQDVILEPILDEETQ